MLPSADFVTVQGSGAGTDPRSGSVANQYVPNQAADNGLVCGADLPHRWVVRTPRYKQGSRAKSN